MPTGFFMQEIILEQETIKSLRIKELPPEAKQRIVEAFAWLIQEDKKQRPAFYQPKQLNKYD